MNYLGKGQLASPIYIYLTDHDVTNSGTTPNMRNRIKGLFNDGSGGTKTTIWKKGDSDRLDIQNEDINGNNIASIFSGSTYSNYSFQAGTASYSVVYIENSITNAIEIGGALKNFKNSKDYDMRLLRLLLTMTLVSNLTGKKIAISKTFKTGQNPITTSQTNILDAAKVDAKGIF